MKNFKRIISVFMAVIMMLSCMSILGYAKAPEVIPTIIIPGLFQSETHYYENGELVVDSNGEPLAAPFYISVSEEFVGAVLTTALVPITTMFITQKDKDQLAAKAFSKIVSELLMGKQQSDANGEFIDDVRAEYYNGSFATLTEKQREKVLSHFPVEEYFDLAGEEYLYVFNYVSTGNMIQTVNELYDYIQFVKEDTSAKKVNIVPVSQGGSITNGLMKLYDEKNIPISRDINRIVFTVPALDGASLLGDCYRYGLNDESEVLYTTMFPSVLGDEGYLGYLINILLRLMPNADVNNLLDIVAETLINDYLKYSTLLWGLIPSGDYEVCRDMYLADDKMAEIRRQADWYYDAQLNSENYILKAKLQGVEVFDIVDTNVELYQLAVSYDEIQADGIIQVDSTSMGAYSTGVNEKLPADYESYRRMCWNPTHDHTDPDGIIDAYSGLLPDTTFYFSGQNHATTASNDVLMSLVIHLLADENFTSVYSYPDKFPQFNYSRETLQLRKDVDTMRAYDTSTLSSADATELKGAIAQVDAMLSNTVIDVAEYEAANDRFYAIYDKIIDGGNSFSEKNTSKTLYVVTKAISDSLYEVYGDAAFSEMPMETLNKIL